MSSRKLREPGPAHSLGREVNLTARAMRALLDSRLERAGTNFATWAVLYMLDAEGPMIQRRLAEHLEVEGPTLVRRIDQLESAGLVFRTDSDADRRATQVSLTTYGRALFRKVKTSVAQTEKELLARFDAAEVKRTRSLLRALTERARALIRPSAELRVPGDGASSRRSRMSRGRRPPSTRRATRR